MSRIFLGIEIGGTKLQLVTGDDRGRLLKRLKLKIERDRGAEGIRKQIVQSIPEILAATKVTAAGVGFGGPVNWQRGQICRSHQIEGWSEFHLSDWLTRSVGAPVYVDNDANVAALGEAVHGAGKGKRTVFYVTLGSGVGGGLVVDGQIYHGNLPGEAEIGHVRLDRHGTTVESRCSGWAVDGRIREALATAPKSTLAKLCGRRVGGEARYLPEALAQEDALAKSILDELTNDLAFGLSHAIHLFHPELIVLGGGLSKLGEPLRRDTETKLKNCVMEVFQESVRVALAALGDDAVPVGALTLCAERDHPSGDLSSL